MTHNSKISARIFIQNSGKEGYKQTVPLPPPKNQTEERDKFFGHRVGHCLAVSAVLGSRIDTPALPPKIQFFGGKFVLQNSSFPLHVVSFGRHFSAQGLTRRGVGTAQGDDDLHITFEFDVKVVKNFVRWNASKKSNEHRDRLHELYRVWLIRNWCIIKLCHVFCQLQKPAYKPFNKRQLSKTLKDLL